MLKSARKGNNPRISTNRQFLVLFLNFLARILLAPLNHRLALLPNEADEFSMIFQGDQQDVVLAGTLPNIHRLQMYFSITLKKTQFFLKQNIYMYIQFLLQLVNYTKNSCKYVVLTRGKETL